MIANLKSIQQRRVNVEITEINRIATILHKARLERAPITQLSKQGLHLTRNEAYQVQAYGLAMREAAGETKLGLKMGLTSEGKRKQMNLDSPLYGELTNKMLVPHEGVLKIAGLIHSKIEPEIAFKISRELHGVVTREQVLQSTESVCACLEILDSRYEQFKYFSMEDVIADNSSSSHFVTGPWVQNFKEIDLRELKMKMSIDGNVVHEALSSEISGDPVVSVIELCRLLAQNGRSLLPGSIVLAGAATAASPLTPGMQVSLSVEKLPEVRVRIES